MVNLPAGAGELFTPAWQARYSRVVERAMPATVRIFWRGDKVYDQPTDTWIYDDTTLYEGKARVQPLRSTRWVTAPGNETPLITMLLSIPVSANPTVNVGAFFDVLEAPLNPDLLRYTFTINEIADSANIIERTFMASFNQETING